MTGEATVGPAVTIRRAAALMRQRALAATPGDRRVIAVRDPGPFDYPARVIASWTTERGGEATTGVADARPEDAEHLATIGAPALALAVAAWLDSWADADVREDGPTPEDWRHALRIARTYLGEPDGDVARDGTELRTPTEWCHEYGLHILDPDGWRTTDAPPWDQPITRGEFHWRAARCTADQNGAWGRLAADVRADVARAAETEA